MIAVREIESEPDIRLLVDRFYEKVRSDAMLGPIFDGIIGNRWPQHLETMYKFWNAVLLERPGYSGKPFSPHASMPISEEHFSRWLELFNETIDCYFTGEKSEEAKWRAGKMAGLFLHKLDYIRSNPGKVIL